MSIRIAEKSRFLIVAWIVILCATPALAQSGAEYARITGQVVGEDGAPLAGVTIRFEATGGSAAAGFEVTTNKKGKFTYPNAQAGSFEAVVDDGWRISKIGMVHIGATIAAGANFETELAPGERTPPLNWMVQSRIRLSMTVVQSGAPTGHSVAEVAAIQDASPILKELNDLFEAQDWGALIDASAEVLAEDPELGGAHYLRGVALLRTEQTGEAVTSMRIAAEMMPDQPGIHGTLATILLKHAADLKEQGEEDAAMEAYGESADLFERQLEETPDSVVYLTNRVAALDFAGNTDRLQGALEALLSVDGSNPNVTLRLAELHIDQGRVDEALDLLSGSGAGSVAAATLIYNAAVEMWNSGDLALTVATVDRGLELAPEMADLYRLKAMALISEDQPQAITLLAKYISMVPEETPGIEADKQLLEALKGRQ